jgi:hypothetical protein
MVALKQALFTRRHTDVCFTANVDLTRFGAHLLWREARARSPKSPTH